MAGWKRIVKDGLPLYQATTLSWFPNVRQGFTTRIGGNSPRPLDSLNMSLAVGDDPDRVAEHRARAASAIGAGSWRQVSAGQVHGSTLAVVDKTSQDLIDGADALITSTPEIVLLMVFADCVPIFFADPIQRAVGLAHSGWRGTAANVAGKTARRIMGEFDCDRSNLFAAIGPSISAERYTVDIEVVKALTDAWPGGSSTPILPTSEFRSQFQINLRLIVFDQLVDAGVLPENISVCDECTFRNKKDFFSHRRDAETLGGTGRMAGMIALAPSASGAEWPGRD